MEVAGDFTPLFRPGLRRDFRDAFQEFPTEYPSYLRVENSREVEHSAVIMAGFSRLQELGDGEAITFQDPKLSRKVMGVDKEFGGGFLITRRTVENDQYGKANGAAKWLAYAARMTYEYRAASFLDDAFTGSTFKGVDNLALCSTVHTLVNPTVSGTTFANTPATQYGFGLTGLTALFQLAMQQPNQTGDPAVITPDTLIIGNDAEIYHRALQIWNSEKEPFTADNQDNAIKMRLQMNRAKPPIISHFKSSRKSYFLVDSKYNDAHLVVFRPVDFDDHFDFQTKQAMYSTTTRFMIWFVDPIGWYGANPT